LTSFFFFILSNAFTSAVAGRRTPAVIIVKCGTEKEAATDKKPGNRGKRDSQLILMNFFSRVTYNDRMSPLDFDLFRKIHVLMGVTPDFFEVVLMVSSHYLLWVVHDIEPTLQVDADTKVFPDSLKYLVNCMHHDQMIMGVCGETRIANKRQSWVTAIQVFEYFISHHLAKAFESVFGGVSCLPGCFSMFRLKARKASGDDWIPLIIKPEIVKEYSQCEVTTLHQKNLLLLGEDRFLTTCLLRTFPNRKMMFLPQARCRTVVPDTFSVLLSQRRRWINSTIHNLMELVLVRNLCGTFCFSMQFVVFMDLLGTVVLPIAISLTYMLIVSMAFSPPKTFEEAIPLMMLVAVLGLPAVLILITTRKVVYVFWMLIYLLALPVWNFLLPLYAFWHFDDFSWGETRLVVHSVCAVIFTDPCFPSSEKWQVKRRIKVMGMEEAPSMGCLCHSDGGRIGSVRDSANSNAKSEGGEKWTEHIRQATMVMVTCLMPAARTHTASMMAQTHSLSIRRRTINGVERLARTTRTTPYILHLQSDFTCRMKPCRVRRLLGLQTLKRCWRQALMTGQPLSQIRTTNPCELLREAALLLDISSRTQLHSVVMAIHH
jgi:hypothetical protein